MSNLHRLRKEHPYLNRCNVISNSDAHYLEDIRDPGYSLLAEDRTPQAVLAALEEVTHIYESN